MLQGGSNLCQSAKSAVLIRNFGFTRFTSYKPGAPSALKNKCPSLRRSPRREPPGKLLRQNRNGCSAQKPHSARIGRRYRNQKSHGPKPEPRAGQTLGVQVLGDVQFRNAKDALRHIVSVDQHCTVMTLARYTGFGGIRRSGVEERPVNKKRRADCGLGSGIAKKWDGTEPVPPCQEET